MHDLDPQGTFVWIRKGSSFLWVHTAPPQGRHSSVPGPWHFCRLQPSVQPEKETAAVISGHSWETETHVTLGHLLPRLLRLSLPDPAVLATRMSPLFR